MPSAPQRFAPRPEHGTREQPSHNDRKSVPVDANDKRRRVRRAASRDAYLIDASGRTVLRCRVQDLSRTGMYATVPVGFGLTVGQCYDICLGRRQEPRSARRYDVASCTGSIIRTDLLSSEDAHYLGIAVQFDMPLPADLLSAV
ncbi:MAG: hypothetical protein JXA69_01415 [Phycisphaerae bacterium]|nr:hypothetical protein [Phycisphaerae bacterium]